MNPLENWLKQATRGLSAASAAQVHAEIGEHYRSSLDAAIAAGATPENASRTALQNLGDPRAANHQYRRVLLTSAEARLLRQGNRESRFLCARPWLMWLVLAVPVAAIIAGATAGDVVLIAIAMAPILAAPFLPIFTPSRARIFRGVKLVAMAGAILALFGPHAVKMSWLLISCLWPLALIEWRRASIRRKLPVAAWPKQLYL
ncbi:MAG TPA: hypothetical protein VG273_28180 [Bryobacteraceae bacterium]|jgi:hypothetical protein|nr:hypothetical protein [Bryobacteraceae bacterium]